jgi:hypothetical protein
MAASHLKAQGDLEAADPKTKASTTLQQAKRTVAYLAHPDASNAPDRRRTRALLRSFRYVSVFIFWRLVRYAKYAAVGAITAAIAGTAIGSVASGAAFIIAPPGIFAGAGVGLIWGLGKFGWRVLAKRVRTGETHNANPRLDEQAEHHPPSDQVKPPRTDPW